MCREICIKIFLIFFYVQYLPIWRYSEYIYSSNNQYVVGVVLEKASLKKWTEPAPEVIVR
jgi:hypothetical protein